jgi:hypothetical protein
MLFLCQQLIAQGWKKNRYVHKEGRGRSSHCELKFSNFEADINNNIWIRVVKRGGG